MTLPNNEKQNGEKKKKGGNIILPFHLPAI